MRAAQWMLVFLLVALHLQCLYTKYYLVETDGEAARVHKKNIRIPKHRVSSHKTSKTKTKTGKGQSRNKALLHPVKPEIKQNQNTDYLDLKVSNVELSNFIGSNDTLLIKDISLKLPNVSLSQLNPLNQNLISTTTTTTESTTTEDEYAYDDDDDTTTEEGSGSTSTFDFTTTTTTEFTTTSTTEDLYDIASTSEEGPIPITAGNQIANPCNQPSPSQNPYPANHQIQPNLEPGTQMYNNQRDYQNANLDQNYQNSNLGSGNQIHNNQPTNQNPGSVGKPILIIMFII